MEIGESSRSNRQRRKRKIDNRNNEGSSHSTLSIPQTSTSNLLVTENNSLLLDLGSPTYSCQYCGAIFWYAERLKSMPVRMLTFSMCCKQGRISLPQLREPPELLKMLFDYDGDTVSKSFRENVRLYNSMFSFTSMGGRIDKDINRGQGPYVFRLNGQNHHLIGSLLPMEGRKPQFAQLYVYDTDNEVSNRLGALSAFGSTENIDSSLVSKLIKILDEFNDLVKAFRMVRDSVRRGEIHSVRLRLAAKRPIDTLQYDSPSYEEMAGLIVGDIGETDYGRDIIIEHQTSGLKRIDDLHPSFMSMQYPLLFPYGEDGYKLNIPYHIDLNKPQIKRGSVTRREYYAYRIQQRNVGCGNLLKGGKLFQQYIVDAFTSIEDERLRYIRFKHQQEHYRSEIYMGIHDAFLRGDSSGNSIGKRIILPSSFTGSPRYMIQNYHDAMAICRSLGNPDLFITFTCNVNWIEIQNALSFTHGQKPVDRPDIISRVFHMKLNELMEDIKKGNHFGRVVGTLYTVEFQKRGLPHVHIIIWLHTDDKHPTPSDINRIISAEIPDAKTHPALYKYVTKFMMHGPCGLANPHAPCMKHNHCTKHFPKKKSTETVIGEDGFAIYRRKQNCRVVVKRGVELDNGFVVPYNPGLLMKYDAHINVEWCNRSRSIKYLFKYVNKGPDRARALLQEDAVVTSSDGSTTPKPIDEISNYIDCRYVSPPESCWRIYEFHIHSKYPAVENLTIHLPLMNSVVYKGDMDVDVLLRQPGVEKSMLTEWMYTNSNFIDARTLTYTEFPSSWRWDAAKKIWFRRKRGHFIGRISYINPSAGDIYYLRMLLAHVRGATNFPEIRTVKGIVYETFKEAANAMGLVGNDREWHEAMNEAALWVGSTELRNLFVTMLICCQVVDSAKLFQDHWESMRDDIVHKLTNMLGVAPIVISEEQLQNQVLIEIEKLLKRNGSSLVEHKLPEPFTTQYGDMTNTLIREELAYNTVVLEQDNFQYTKLLNEEQLCVFDVVVSAVNQLKGGLYFVYGHGGTGKTFLYKAITTHLRSKGKIVLAVASSGIASLLLPGGRTAHSRFKIPINIHGESSCHIKKGTHLAELLKNTSLILWDEAPMAHRHCFEALDRSMADIFNDCDGLQPQLLPFGGKPVLLGGDFRQILPVVVKGSRHDTIMACLTKSNLWMHCRVFHLTKNMRLSTIGLSIDDQSEMQKFSEWLLSIGEGRVETFKMTDDDIDADWIHIPGNLLVERKGCDVEDITNEIYTEIQSMYSNIYYLKQRAIITPTNEAVDVINAHVLSLIPFEQRTYLSADSISKDDGESDEDNLLYPTEYLNSLVFNGLPNHELCLKVNTPVMLLRNINQSHGLCNGTRLMVTKLGDRVIQATVITGSNIGDEICVPRIIMTSSERK